MAAFAAVYKPPQAAGFRGGVSPLRGNAAFGNESRTTSLRSWKYTPIPAYGGTSPKGKHVTGFSGRFTPLQIQFLCHPGGGSLLSASPCANLSSSLYSDAKTSPSGGGAVGRRGAFPSRQRRGCMVFPARKAVCLFSPGESPVIKVFFILRRRRHHNPRLRSRRQSLAPWAVFVAFFPFFLGLVGHSGLEQKMSSLPLLYVFFTIMEPQVGQN